MHNYMQLILNQRHNSMLFTDITQYLFNKLP